MQRRGRRRRGFPDRGEQPGAWMYVHMPPLLAADDVVLWVLSSPLLLLASVLTLQSRKDWSASCCSAEVCC